MDITMAFAEAHREKSRSDQEKIIDQELERLDAFLMGLPDSAGGGKMARGERAIVKTYIVQKLNGGLDGKGPG